MAAEKLTLGRMLSFQGAEQVRHLLSYCVDYRKHYNSLYFDAMATFGRKGCCRKLVDKQRLSVSEMCPDCTTFSSKSKSWLIEK